MSENEIPMVSTSYETDLKMINFCKSNPGDVKCKCIIPEEGIYKLQISLFNPYYCWYSPCTGGSSFVTSVIAQERRKCNIVLCDVSLGEVTLNDNGVLNVKNNCISSKNFSNITISQVLLEPSLKDEYVLPNYFSRTALPLLVGLGFVLFLRSEN